MRPWIKLCICIALLRAFGGSLVHSQEWPTIMVTYSDRAVTAKPHAENERLLADSSSVEVGPFADHVEIEAVGDLGSVAKAEAEQDTQISVFSVTGNGRAWGSAALGSGQFASVRAIAESEVNLEFTVPIDAAYTLSGSFTATGPGAPSAVGIVSIAGLGVGGLIYDSRSFNAGDAPSESSFSFSRTAAANSTLTFHISAWVGPEGETDGSMNALGEAEASFEFKLDFGDRDGDGLLDSWETDGIDFDGQAPPDIDLPGMGANPDVKDLFVEVDVMTGVHYDQGALDDVVAAFSRAPAEAVDNPNGAPGIQLHIITDGDSPFALPLIVPPVQFLPDDFYSIKKEFFGSDVDRNHPDWDEIREARLKVFRYCVWADSIENGPNLVLGLAEGVPSNDFIVAAGTLSSTPELTSVLRDALAGIFMHELGHTLGLRHGGQQNRPPSRPNYLSVMNHFYDIPYDVVTRDGQNAKEVWRLDYSRESMMPLDESRVLEFDGIDGLLTRKIIFNTTPLGETPRLAVDWANATAVDWNDNEVYETDTYELDLSCFGCDPTDARYEKLNSYTDWDNLSYSIHDLVGSNDGTNHGSAQDDFCLTKERVETVLNSEWIDHSASRDQIFSDDFELGSRYWSATVP